MITILITCFDISGDHNGYDLILYARRHYPKKFRFLCLAGERIRKLEGSDVIMIKDHITESSVGIIEGMQYLFSTLALFRWFRSYLKRNKIDIHLCIDGQGRNLVLGKISKQTGIKTVYFFPPHVSIIGKWNVKKMKWFDLILNPFLADHQIYSKAGHRSVYTGHPFQNILTDDYQPEILGKTYPYPLVSIFPGSRYQEIKTLLPVFLSTVKQLQKYYPQYSWVVSLSHEDFRPLVERDIHNHGVKVDIIHDHSEAIMAQSYFILACSGTTTLKASFFGAPHFIAYKISWSTYLIARFLIYVDYIGMVNIAVNRPVVNEFINHHLSVGALVKETGRYLGDPGLREDKSKELREICQKYFCHSENLNPYKIVWREITLLLESR